MIDPPAPQSALIQWLERTRAREQPLDKDELATLRRTLPRLPDHPDLRALALVVRHAGSTRASQDAALLTACLWSARHRTKPPASSAWNLGRALHHALGERSRRQRMWQALYTAARSNLPRTLIGAVDILSKTDTPMDWHRLHRDLRSWHQGDEQAVLRRWCTGMFGPLPDQPPHQHVQSETRKAEEAAL